MLWMEIVHTAIIEVERIVENHRMKKLELLLFYNEKAG